MTIQEWVPHVDYRLGTVVMFEDKLYKCLQSHISNDLYNPRLYQHVLWTNNEYSIKSNVNIVSWRPDTYYYKDSLIEFYGNVYKCILSHLSLQFHSPLFMVGILWSYFDENEAN